MDKGEICGCKAERSLGDVETELSDHKVSAGFGYRAFWSWSQRSPPVGGKQGQEGSRSAAKVSTLAWCATLHAETEEDAAYHEIGNGAGVWLPSSVC
jgi:hypothetical protein